MKYTIWTWKHPSIFLKYNILSEDVLHFHGNTGSIWMWGKESGETKEKKPQGGENLFGGRENCASPLLSCL